MYNSKQPQTPLTYESLMASIHESNHLLTEQIAESNIFLTEKFAETERLIKKREEAEKKSKEDFDRRWKKIDETIGSWANNYGFIAEEYFFNSFERGKKNFFGEKFNEITKGLKGRINKLEDEYDIVMFNGSSIAIVETKYKAHVNDVPQVLKKAETFRILFPYHKDLKIYLGLATMAFYPELEQACINKGIAVIKQVGETVIIHDEHLKVF
jgi:hypothetical protein